MRGSRKLALIGLVPVLVVFGALALDHFLLGPRPPDDFGDTEEILEFVEHPLKRAKGHWWGHRADTPILISAFDEGLIVCRQVEKRLVLDIFRQKKTSLFGRVVLSQVGPRDTQPLELFAEVDPFGPQWLAIHDALDQVEWGAPRLPVYLSRDPGGLPEEVRERLLAKLREAGSPPLPIRASR